MVLGVQVFDMDGGSQPDTEHNLESCAVEVQCHSHVGKWQKLRLQRWRRHWSNVEPQVCQVCGIAEVSITETANPGGNGDVAVIETMGPGGSGNKEAARPAEPGGTADGSTVSGHDKAAVDAAVAKGSRRCLGCTSMGHCTNVGLNRWDGIWACKDCAGWMRLECKGASECS